MKRYTRMIRQNLVGISTKIAKQYGVTYGTVISRNPDGSLNVDTGQGTCQRIMAAQNVRIGDQIPIGTEPSIGQTTNLPPVNLTIPPSGQNCPQDPRLIPPQVPVSATINSSSGGQCNNAFPAPWITRPGNIAFAGHSNVGFYAQLLSEFGGVNWALYRGFGAFAITLPAGAVITEAHLTLKPTTVHSDNNRDVCIVGAYFPGFPLLGTYMNDLDLDHHNVLGRFRILDAVVGTPFDIALDPTSPYLYYSPIKLAMVIDYDLDNGGIPPLFYPGNNDQLWTSFTGGTAQLNVTYGIPITVDTQE